MTLYTSKVVAAWLGVTERRVRQLRDEGIISEEMPGLYNLRKTVTRYISYIRKGSSDLNDERAGLTKAKREAAEMENALRRGELHRTEDIEAGIKNMLLNMKSRLLILPGKLSETLAGMQGNREEIFDLLSEAVNEALNELKDYSAIMAERKEEEDGEDA